MNKKIPREIIEYFKYNMNMEVSNDNYIVSYLKDEMANLSDTKSSFMMVISYNIYIITNKDTLENHFTVNTQNDSGKFRIMSVHPGVDLGDNQMHLFKKKISDLRYLKAEDLSNKINKKLGPLSINSTSKIKL